MCRPLVCHSRRESVFLVFAVILSERSKSKDLRLSLLRRHTHTQVVILAKPESQYWFFCLCTFSLVIPEGNLLLFCLDLSP
jgi:hypothetical protein